MRLAIARTRTAVPAADAVAIHSEGALNVQRAAALHENRTAQRGSAAPAAPDGRARARAAEKPAGCAGARRRSAAAPAEAAAPARLASATTAAEAPVSHGAGRQASTAAPAETTERTISFERVTTPVTTACAPQGAGSATSPVGASGEARESATLRAQENARASGGVAAAHRRVPNTSAAATDDAASPTVTAKAATAATACHRCARAAGPADRGARCQRHVDQRHRGLVPYEEGSAESRPASSPASPRSPGSAGRDSIRNREILNRDVDRSRGRPRPPGITRDEQSAELIVAGKSVSRTIDDEARGDRRQIARRQRDVGIEDDRVAGVGRRQRVAKLPFGGDVSRDWTLRRRSDGDPEEEQQAEDGVSRSRQHGSGV